MLTRLRGRTNRDASLWFWVFVGPFFAGLVLFIYVPIGWSVYLSFFEAYNTVTPTEFVGLANYRDMLTDQAFRDSLLTFVVFAAFIVPTTFALSLLTALLVARTRVMQAFFRSVFFLPVACSYVVAALVWKMSIFSGMSSGAANALLGLAGVSPIPWLSITDPPWYWLVIVSARLWLQVGFYMILFLAALQRVPVTLYEAAAIDGAEGWQVFRRITWPQLLPASTAVLLLLLINAFQAFDEFYNILAGFSGYPPYARPPLVYLYYTALGSGQNFGDGSAGAVILTVLIAVVALAQTRLLRLGGRD
ncbi:carbohydrate ABC transporter permease [uncultured Serinicoccus sp.]|uniref:carbohydrate ABC transporter permease n=1 Tax=uncultured Serinicoccus sp. TaxID=735514 RepID=UPI0026089580|nr:sugar ABC transporter permease [uncultured Serinicoccus sp.]